MLVELAVRAVKNGKDQIVPSCSDAWQFSQYTYLCQSVQAKGLQEKWKIHMIKWDFLRQHRYLILSTSIFIHSLEGGGGLTRSKTLQNRFRNSMACSLLNCTSAPVAEEQMVYEIHLWDCTYHLPKQILDPTSRWFTSISQNTSRLLETQLLWTFPGVHMAQQHVTETNSVFRKNLENCSRKKIFWVEAEGQEWRSCGERSMKLEAVRADSSTEIHTSSVERWPEERQVWTRTKGFPDLSLSSTSKGTIAQRYIF